MRRIAHRVVLGLSACGTLLAGSAANAQGPAPTANTPAGSLANPYVNPYLNPYLNPALTTGSTSRNDAMLYLWAAQQQPGGLLGPRPTGRTGSSSRVAEMPRSAMKPGGGASRFFNRGQTAAAGGADGLGNRYQRMNRYYSNNGR